MVWYYYLMVEPLDPEKFHIMRKETKRKLYIVGLIFVFILLPILLNYYYNIAINRPSQLTKELTFVINDGDGVVTISRNLRQQNAVNSEFLFILYVFLNKLDKNLQAGTYKIDAGTPVSTLAWQLQHGVNDAKITFIEGWRVEEFARALNIQFEKTSYADFVKRAQQYEGYLFPDTYYFDRTVKNADIISVLLDNFGKRTAGVLTDDNIKKVGLTREQIVTLASIVEREADTDEDRAIVAGILLKRFKSNIPLGVDATTQYAVAPIYLCGPDGVIAGICTATIDEVNQFNWWPSKLTQSDLDMDSPFNTRKVVGLPPHPICNPGLSAITAVINSKQTDYLYYLTDKSGKMHYAVTLAEHNANISKFLQ